MRLMALLTLWLAGALAHAAQPESPAPVASGEVRVPIEVYDRLVETAREERAPAPAAYAFGVAHVEVAIVDDGDRTSAQISARLGVEVFERGWTLVPILPPGTALAEVTANGAPVQLVQTADGLAWSTNRPGKVEMQLSYSADVRPSDMRVLVCGESLTVGERPAADEEFELNG